MAKRAKQQVVIGLSNGTKGIFSGYAIAFPGQSEGVRVTQVKFLAPTLADKKKADPDAPAKPEDAKKPEAEAPVPPVPEPKA